MQRLNLVLGVYLCSVGALVGTPGQAQLSNHAVSLTGTVFSEGDRRVENAAVSLCDEQGNRLADTNSNHAGEFSFSGLRAERYVVRVRVESFALTEVSVDLSAGSQHGISVTLRGLPQPGAAVPGSALISAHELSVPEEARALLDSGTKKLYADKSAESALRDFQSAIRKAPGYYEAYYQAGMAYLALQRQGEAEQQFRKAVELSQNKFGDAEIALATLLLQRNEQREGEPLLRQGLSVNPQSWPGQVELGKLELSRGHVEPALAAAQKAAALAPSQPMVYRLLALVHIREKDYAALRVDLDNYIRLDPDSPAGKRAKEMRAEVERQMPEAATVRPGGSK